VFSFVTMFNLLRTKQGLSFAMLIPLDFSLGVLIFFIECGDTLVSRHEIALRTCFQKFHAGTGENDVERYNAIMRLWDTNRSERCALHKLRRVGFYTLEGPPLRDVPCICQISRSSCSKRQMSYLVQPIAHASQVESSHLRKV
jgi:hypothetical protein